MELKFTTELWEWQGQGAWCFLSVPKKYYATLKDVSTGPKHGFGSLRVEASIGKSAWKTSIFSDNKSGTFLLPVKKDVRKKENIAIGDIVKTNLRLVDV